MHEIKIYVEDVCFVFEFIFVVFFLLLLFSFVFLCHDISLFKKKIGVCVGEGGGVAFVL